MTESAFCPQCGTPRVGAFKYCRSCGLDFDTGRPAAPATPATNAPPQSFSERYGTVPPAAPAPSTLGPMAPHPGGPVYTLIGLSWIGAAVLTGYLAYLQLSYAGLFPEQSLQQTALFNGVGAALTLYFGAKLLTAPGNRTWLNRSILWALLNVVWGALQVSQGITADVFILSLVLMGVAGVLSFVARGQLPSDEPTPG